MNLFLLSSDSSSFDCSPEISTESLVAFTFTFSFSIPGNSTFNSYLSSLSTISKIGILAILWSLFSSVGDRDGKRQSHKDDDDQGIIIYSISLLKVSKMSSM